MEIGRWERLAPLTGIVFAVLLFASFAIPGTPPSADDSTAKVVHYWSTHDTENIIAALVGAVAVVFFIWFASSLRSAIMEAEGGTGRLAAIVYGGAVIVATGASVAVGFAFAAADSVGDVPAAVTQTLSVLNIDTFLFFSAGIAVFWFGTAFATFKTRVLPVWLAWVSMVLAIVAFTPAALAAVLGFLIWVIIVSVLLYRRQPKAATPTAPATT
jgi:hypothetical protein